MHSGGTEGMRNAEEGGNEMTWKKGKGGEAGESSLSCVENERIWT